MALLFPSCNLGKLFVLSELNLFCKTVTIIVRIIIIIIRPAFKVVVRVRCVNAGIPLE